MGCSNQCHGCAFRKGAAANAEPENNLRGVLAVLGGYPFYCHEGLGWTPDKTGYDPNVEQSAKVILDSAIRLPGHGRRELLQSSEAAELRPRLKVRGGWKNAVCRLKEQGWFERPEIREVRRIMAISAASDLNGLEDARYSDVRMRNLRETMQWFVDEARDARVKIRWLFQGRAEL